MWKNNKINLKVPDPVICKVLWVAVVTALSDSSKLHCRTHVCFCGYSRIFYGQPGGRYSLTWSPNGYGFLATLIKNRVGKITDFGLK